MTTGDGVGGKFGNLDSIGDLELSEMFKNSEKPNKIENYTPDQVSPLWKKRSIEAKYRFNGSSNPVYNIPEPIEMTFMIYLAEVKFFMQQSLVKQGKEPIIKKNPKNKENGRIVSEIIYNQKGSFILVGDNSGGKTFFIDHLCMARNILLYENATVFNRPILKIDYQTLYKQKDPIELIDNIQRECLRGKDLFIDDLGYKGQSQKNNYGNKIDLVTEIAIVVEKLIMSGLNVYITSNIDSEFIMTNYGKGTHDRLMRCSIIKWDLDGNGYR